MKSSTPAKMPTPQKQLSIVELMEEMEKQRERDMASGKFKPVTKEQLDKEKDDLNFPCLPDDLM